MGAAFNISVPGSPGCAVPHTVAPSFSMNGMGRLTESWRRLAHDLDDILAGGRPETGFHVQFIGDHAQDLAVDYRAVLEVTELASRSGHGIRRS